MLIASSRALARKSMGDIEQLIDEYYTRWKE